MINVQPLKSFSSSVLVTSCIDDHITTVAVWAGKETRAMYADAWRFVYQENPQELLMNRVSYPKLNLELLEQVHGLQVSFTERDFTGTTLNSNQDEEVYLDRLEKELCSGMPVLVGIDVFYCPWSETYLKSHARHSSLAVGLDRPGREIDLVDSYYGITSTAFALDVFLAASPYYACFSSDPSFSFNPDWRTLLSISLFNPDHGITPQDVLQDLCTFALAYLEEGIVTAEPEAYMIPFMHQFMKFPLARMRYSSFLLYMYEISGEQKLHVLSGQFTELAKRWEAMMQQVMKCFFSGNSITQREKMYQKMLGMIAKEEELFRCLENLA
ncbi:MULTISPECIES: hypothetical protein [unclassified Paenibacillus]|uniref:hypothetical protein n=1 Tax=unclassified Paenibacillus TaxID=185978 RepID=UPI0009A59492|nr:MULTISPECIES: hypothetical protein [unclassified Paenibacillus]SLK20882.1 hypothetical protein SAMN06272722_11735 [Paenibacillus sp. RU5A]SOC76349.1 hypothetical protein SAMN05880581_11735 [Paenibacillus sp. RU26A]SOC77944.1 hypothetical protein SAMN05880586_11746 [Paenibacillus sp. RU5M]